MAASKETRCSNDAVVFLRGQSTPWLHGVLKIFHSRENSGCGGFMSKLVLYCLLVVAGSYYLLWQLINLRSASTICNLVCLFSCKTHIKYICLIKPPGKCRTTFVYQMRVPLVGNLCIRTYVREKIRNGNVCLQFASCQGESVAEKVTVHYGYCTAFTQQRCLCLACMTFVCLKLWAKGIICVYSALACLAKTCQ